MTRVSGMWFAAGLAALMMMAGPAAKASISSASSTASDGRRLEFGPRIEWSVPGLRAMLQGVGPVGEPSRWSGGLAGSMPIGAGLMLNGWTAALVEPGVGSRDAHRFEAGVGAGLAHGGTSPSVGVGVARSRRGSNATTSGIVSMRAGRRLGPATLDLSARSNWFRQALDQTEILSPGLAESLGVPSVTGATGSVGRGYSDLNLRLASGRSRISVALNVGYRLGYRPDAGEPRSTARLEGSLRLAPGWSLRSAIGRAASEPELARPSRRFGSLSLSLDLGRPSDLAATAVDAPADPRPAFRLRTLRGNERRLRVTWPGADRIDLSGDFTDWQAVTLRRVDRSTWEIDLPIPAGVHRVSLRRDARDWEAPPGLHAVTDEFGAGGVGLLVVK